MRVPARRVAPVVLGDAVDVEHHLRAHPAGRQRHGGAAVRRQLLALRERQPDHRRLGQVVERREPVVRRVVLGVPSVISTTSPPGRRISSARAKWLVIRCVSIARRSIRSPLSRSCSQTGLFHSASCSPPQMSLTRTSSRPCSASIRCDERLDLRRIQMVDPTAIPSPPAASPARRSPRSSPAGRTPIAAPCRSAGALDRRPRLSERDRHAAAGTAGRARHERHLSRRASSALPGLLRSRAEIRDPRGAHPPPLEVDGGSDRHAIGVGSGRSGRRSPAAHFAGRGPPGRETTGKPVEFQRLVEGE